MTPDELRLRLLPRVQPEPLQPILQGRPGFPGWVQGPLVRASPTPGCIWATARLDSTRLSELLACAGLITADPAGLVVSQGFELPGILVDELPELPEATVLLDGAGGRLFPGGPRPERPPLDAATEALLRAADGHARLQVLANVDEVGEWLLARRYGAGGIGLCRWERLPAGDPGAHLRALLRAAATRPVTVRLSDDPPPHGMWGLRWCRPGLLEPDLYRGQLDTLRQAAQGYRGELSVLVPGPLGPAEFLAVRRLAGERRLGAMLELPAACLAAGDLARHADFLTFGTNDLTQAVLGMSREEARFGLIPRYLELGLLEHDPFRILHERVIQLMELALQAIRRVRPDLKVGVCGDHAGVPANIPALDRLGVDQVSCYPQHVPSIRLAAGGRTDRP